MNLNELAAEVHQIAEDHGWWEDERHFPEIAALIHSEVSEALEEWRTHRGGNERIVDGKPEGLSVELADVIIRILDFCGREGIDIHEAVTAKIEYNRHRPYRHGGKHA